MPAGDDHTLLAEEVGRGTPVVLLDLEVDDVTGVDLVRSDHRGGARLAVRHLIAHGHRDIAFLGDVPSIFSARERYRGYVDAMRAARIKRRPEWTVHGLDTAAAAATVRALFAPGVDAGRARCSPLRTSSRWVPYTPSTSLGLHGTVALAAFDDVDMADVVEPALTVVPQQPTDLGRQAGELLLDRIRGHRGPARRVILRNELIVRGSGEIPPAARKRDEVARRQA